MARKNNLTIEGAKIVLRNFAGGPDKYNKAPGRNFCVLIDPENAKAMEDDGWNIKYFNRKPDDDPDEPQQAFLRVAVSYKQRPPVIVVLSQNLAGQLVRRNYGEDLVDLLDNVDITNVDLMISPYRWEVDGKSGIKAYLDSLYITIDANRLEQKYADVDYVYGAG